MHKLRALGSDARMGITLTLYPKSYRGQQARGGEASTSSRPSMQQISRYSSIIGMKHSFQAPGKSAAMSCLSIDTI